ncbi:hypothetical protein CAPTEDRAFT_206146 [Capitella teleta]|uniref:Uncharacterized protein n=1 Tax=Capitella teleta TaxID=283909 RepID=R7UI39_CAPTE|nr:hypothetical protein CAPTEDRAFT_206146 [Capitella teleta]|eukprot:ELU05885.1 hypothetical protein CAPTEDRAFT_206146 [Capitella teleta]
MTVNGSEISFTIDFKCFDVIELPAERTVSNGGSKCIKCHADIESFRSSCAASSVMVARAAQWNPSVFRADGLLPLHDVIKRLLHYCVLYDNSTHNSKYCAQQMLHEELDRGRGKQLVAASTLRGMCEIFDMADFYDSTVAAREARSAQLCVSKNVQPFKRRRLNDGSHLILAENLKRSLSGEIAHPETVKRKGANIVATDRKKCRRGTLRGFFMATFRVWIGVESLSVSYRYVRKSSHISRAHVATGLFSSHLSPQYCKENVLEPVIFSKSARLAETWLNWL